MPKKDDISKFKQIIDKLPEDKRKFLYKRLHSMPESEREAYISDFIKKYSSKEKEPAAEKNVAQSIIIGILAAFVSSCASSSPR